MIKLSYLTKITVSGMILLIYSGSAFSQTVGSYGYAAGSTTGTMSVSDISECVLHDKLGCMSEVRPIKVHIKTIDQKSGNDCDLDATENTTARVQSADNTQAFLNIDSDETPKGHLTVVFDKAGAVVTPDKNNVSSGCGAGVGFGGRWKRASGTTNSSAVPAQVPKTSIRGFSIGSTDIKSAIDGIPDLLCREQGNQTHCLDQSEGLRHGQTYDVYVNSRKEIYGITYTFCVYDASTMDIITSNIMKPFVIKVGAKMLDSKASNSLVFDGQTEDGRVRIGLLTAKACTVGGHRGLTYSQVLISDELKSH